MKKVRQGTKRKESKVKSEKKGERRRVRMRTKE